MAAPDTTLTLVAVALRSGAEISITVSGYLVGGICIILAVILGWRILRYRLKSYEINEAEFGIGNQKIKLRPNTTDLQIAYKVWVELSTRKIGLPINLDNDVLIEIYGSWYEFFSVTRELIKDIPATRFRRKGTERLIRLTINILNSGIRPHLTQHQARFKRWYERSVNDPQRVELSPQEVQKEYPGYDELANDLQFVNQRLIKYRNRMHSFISRSD